MNTRFARLRWFLGGAIAATALIFSTGASNENDRQPDVRRDQVAVAPAASPAAAIAQRDEADDGKLRIICFGAHPDDCELRAAGVAAKWAALGHHVKFVAVTNGDIGHWQIAGGVLAQRRSAEVKRCANRGEIERFRGPMLQDVGVRTRIWVKAGMGHGLPDEATAVEVLTWLDEAAASRRKLATATPTTRAPADQGLDRAQQAAQLLAQAEKLIGVQARTYEALMLMKGVSVRWPDLPEAKRATQTLLRYDAQPDGRWRDDDVAEQRRFLIARARGLDRYASGELPKPYTAQRVGMARAALQLWEQVIADGQDEKAVAEAQLRLSELKKIVDGTPSPDSDPNT